MVESSSNRIQKYKAKLKSKVIGGRYDTTKDIAAKKQKAYFKDADELQTKVKALMSGISSILHHYYMDYAFELRKKKTSDERNIIYEKWKARGLLEAKLIEIGDKLFGWTPPIIPPPALAHIWVMDDWDQEVYRYTEPGVFVDQFDTTGHGFVQTGITTDNNFIWVVGWIEQTIWRYNMAGVFDGQINIGAHGINSQGITTDGTNLYVIDGTLREVFIWTMAGAYVGSWDTSAHGIQNRGIGCDGTNIYILDRIDQEVYIYTKAGAYLGSWDTSAQTTDPHGLTTDGVHVWISDPGADRVYRYTIAGAYLDSFDISAKSGNGEGVTTNKRYL